ncbi:MAG: response regulator [Candidatus Acidiferrales bacterium]|jgi:two-component system cell cycle response regulator DivK
MTTEAPNASTAPEDIVLPEQKKSPTGRERRKRHRAQVAMRVLVRGGIGSLEPFEDVGNTIDASRDGLLVKTSRGAYWQGQIIEVTVPYDGVPDPTNPPQRARVVRNVLLDNHLFYGLAVEFQKALAMNADGVLVAGSVPVHVRVLAVEPDERMAGVIRDLLEADGYQVMNVSSSKEALEVLSNDTPDVLLAVAESGEISGQDLCAIIKKNARLQHIPVILLMHSAKPADYLSCHEVGAVVCMALPCPPGKLQHAVRLVAPPPSLRSSYNGKVNVSSIVRTT